MNRLNVRRWQNDAGLGMTELAVAILVLGVVVIGILPFVSDSIRLATSNAQVGQANRFVATNIDLARTESLSVSCTSGSLVGASPRGGLFVDGPEGLAGDVYFSCTDGASQLVTVRVDVWRDNDPDESPISTATTKVIAS